MSFHKVNICLTIIQANKHNSFSSTEALYRKMTTILTLSITNWLSLVLNFIYIYINTVEWIHKLWYIQIMETIPKWKWTYKERNGSPELLSIQMVNYSSYCQTVFQSEVISLFSHQKYRGSQVVSYPHPNLVLSVFKNLGKMMGI